MSTAVALLANPTAGRGRGATYAGRALRRLRGAGVEVTALQGADHAHALDLARAALAGGTETLVVVGGDGMVQLGADAVAGTSARLGVVPAGTGNDVARTLGLPRRDPDAAVEVVLRGHHREVDLMAVSGRRHVTVLSAGFDALVNERANQLTRPRGQLRYTLAALDRLRVLEPIGYTIELDGETIRTEATLVAVANMASFGGGLRIAEGARPDDGYLDVVVVAPLTRRELARSYPRLFTGSLETHPRYERRRARRVTVAAPGVVAYADGERVGPLPLTAEVVPGALRVLVP
ncbi:diacylglycerol kinase [Marmoricola endophyticus]|uniref:Diacylglycerol kinase n=1 Tax=Marmoricola endophyticus TaxID=2040280 RepID=A0A917BAG0_9ACTN|nr:YegS/Rv2252/BmrU family lipid kinase [Marmoricola endophyticus]GGF34400.1 diacylglycerol kinase [Marmoricola endophyticus]